MSFAQYNSGVAMGTGSSADPLRVGLIFLGLLSIVIISISFVCCIWKLIEVFVEKHRRRSVIQRHEESTEDEVQVKVDEGRCRLKLTKKFVEMLKGMISDSAAIIHRLNKAPATQEEQEQLCDAAAAAAAAAAKAKKSIIPFEIV